MEQKGSTAVHSIDKQNNDETEKSNVYKYTIHVRKNIIGD